MVPNGSPDRVVSGMRSNHPNWSAAPSPCASTDDYGRSQCVADAAAAAAIAAMAAAVAGAEKAASAAAAAAAQGHQTACE